MITIKTFISKEKPTAVYGLWLKPVEKGFTIYLIENGITKSLKLVDDQNTEDTKDDEVKDLIGSVQDAKTANTINGAKAYAKDVQKEIIGSPKDDASELTLHGLKNLIEEKIIKSNKNYVNKNK